MQPDKSGNRGRLEGRDRHREQNPKRALAPEVPFAGRVQMARLSPLKSAKNAGGRRGPWAQRGISSTGIPETTPARQVSGWTRDRDVDTDPPGTRPAGPGRRELTSDVPKAQTV